MAETLTLRIVTTECAVDGALALAGAPAFLPGVDVVALPAGLDVERVNGLLGATVPAAGQPVAALRDLPAEGVRAGDLGMLEEDDVAVGGRLRVLVGERSLTFTPRSFAPAWAMTFLRLQAYGGRFRHVIAASGPSTDLRYLAVAARAATAAVTVLGTPDQIFRMVGPRDAAGVPASSEFRIAVSGGGHRRVRVTGEGGTILGELILARR